ncbi:CTV [Salix suchowensis]|nr:CTV [Salix suchowensis]
MSEYNILNTLQQMTMAANAYKTQTGTPDRAITELLIAGFLGQLKGWWDYHLTEADHLHILNAIQQYEDKTPVLDSSGNTVQDAVTCLILTISLHFIRDPSHLKDKNAELLSNLRCKKLSDFQWYKNTFMTRVMLREDSNQPFWKEKFLAGLPILLGEKVRNKIKDTFSTKLIPYDQLTYGELVNFTQKEGLKICQDLKLQKHLKWEMKRTKQELGSFCHQFDISTSKPSCKPEQPYYKKPYKRFTKHPKNRFQPKTKPFDWKTATCYKCNQKGHTAAFCKFQKKLHELNIDEETINMLQNLYLETSDTDPSSSDISEEEFQVDELADSSATSDTSKSNEVSVLTQNQEFILEAIKRLDDPQLQRVYLDNLLKNFNKTEQPPVNPPTRTMLPSTSTNTYDLTKILNSDSEEEATDPDLQALHALHDTNLDQIDNAFLDVLSQISSKKYIVKLSLVFSDDFKLDTIALFDTGADLNCIKEGKTQASVLNNGISVTTFFVVTKDINHTIILGTPFIDLLTPYKVHHDCITSRINEKQIPTKARPIQMNAELEQHCRQEIQDLESKGLITKSRSPWSCAAFYNPHFLPYTYWDYEQAWFNAFLIQNQGNSHSWLFFFNTSIDTTNLPIWFKHWWDMFGCIPELLHDHPSTEEGYKFFKDSYQPIPSERRYKPITLFCAKFFLPWVCSWYYDYSSIDGSIILIRRFKVKWWDAFRKEPQCSLKAVQDWFKTNKLVPTIHQSQQSQFFAQKAKTAALLASAQTQEEYLQILQSLAPTKEDESVSSNASSSSSASSPVISLGNDNEDDCYGILPPVKHSSKEVIKRR